MRASTRTWSSQWTSKRSSRYCASALPSATRRRSRPLTRCRRPSAGRDFARHWRKRTPVACAGRRSANLARLGMLNDLDAVPWQSVRHAFGEASEVQRMLRELASSNRELRQSALKELFACLVHQGTVSEASALAVPFLFELLADPATRDRHWIAFLLASIGVG